MTFKNRNETLLRDLRYRDRLLIVMAVFCFMTLYGWSQAPRELTLHYPPDLRSGAVQKADAIPVENVYAFSRYIFQELQNWQDNGAVDYEHNRIALRAFLTPQYQRFIVDDIKARRSELQQRRREIYPVPGAFFESKSVKVTGPDSWVVFLDFQVREYIQGSLVKDVYIRYPMSVIRYNIAREANPWQLALAGYVSEPIRLAKQQEESK
jgi:integrating conjugative element protein (TIGR03746 family)